MSKLLLLMVLLVAAITLSGCVENTVGDIEPKTPKEHFVNTFNDNIVSGKISFDVVDSNSGLVSVKINSNEGVREIEFEDGKGVRTYYFSKKYAENEFVFCEPAYILQEGKEVVSDYCRFVGFKTVEPPQVEKFFVELFKETVLSDVPEENFKEDPENGCILLEDVNHSVEICQNSEGKISISLSLAEMYIFLGKPTGDTSYFKTGFSSNTASEGIKFKKNFQIMPHNCNLDNIAVSYEIFNPAINTLNFTASEKGGTRKIEASDSFKESLQGIFFFDEIGSPYLYNQYPWLVDYLKIEEILEFKNLEIKACNGPDCSQIECMLNYGVFREEKVKEQPVSACFYFLWDQEFDSFQCYRHFAIKNKDESLCEQAGSFKDGCYYELAEQTKNEALCQKIENETNVKACTQAVRSKS